MPNSNVAPPGGRLVGSDRVLAVLTELAKQPAGATLEEMVRRTGHPKPTVHRALAALKRAGLASQDGRGHYVLGELFLELAFAHYATRPEHAGIHPILERLAGRFGETAHFATLDGHDVVYRDKVDPDAAAVKLTSTIGGRNPAHCTAVGKSLLADRLLTLHDVEEWIGDNTLEARTPQTATAAVELHEQLAKTRELGYAVDDQENERGINCLALPVTLISPSSTSGAISVSAVAYRTPLAQLVDSVDEMREIIAETLHTPGAAAPTVAELNSKPLVISGLSDPKSIKD